MYDLPHDLVEALQAGPETLAGLLDGISTAQAHAARGGDENWSIVEVACHLRDAEEFFVKRLQTMRDQVRPAIAGYNQEELARERNYQAADLQEALTGFTAFRQQATRELSALSPEQWQRPGLHSDLGEITIFVMTVHHAAHDAIHCAQIARQLKGSRG